MELTQPVGRQQLERAEDSPRAVEGVLLGFSIVAVLTGVGLATAALAKETAETIQRGLTPVVYYITNPALMVVLVSGTDVTVVAGLYTPLALMIAFITGAVFVGYSLVLRRRAAEIAVGAMSASYVNAGNIGVPIALYMVGTTAPVVAVLLAQLLVLAPLYLAVFGWLSTRGGQRPGKSRWRTIISSVLNPTTMGVVVGAGLSLLHIDLPTFIWEPLRMVGESSIPLMLIIFGMALWRQRPFTEPAYVLDSVVATFCKTLLMPAVAWVLAGPLLGLEGSDLLGVVAMAALPTAQNVLLFGMHYAMPVSVGKDTVFTSAILSLPVILVAAWLIGS